MRERCPGQEWNISVADPFEWGKLHGYVGGNTPLTRIQLTLSIIDHVAAVCSYYRSSETESMDAVFGGRDGQEYSVPSKAICNVGEGHAWDFLRHKHSRG